MFTPPAESPRCRTVGKENGRNGSSGNRRKGFRRPVPAACLFGGGIGSAPSVACGHVHAAALHVEHGPADAGESHGCEEHAVRVRAGGRHDLIGLGGGVRRGLLTGLQAGLLDLRAGGSVGLGTVLVGRVLDRGGQCGLGLVVVALRLGLRGLRAGEFGLGGGEGLLGGVEIRLGLADGGLGGLDRVGVLRVKPYYGIDECDGDRQPRL